MVNNIHTEQILGKIIHYSNLDLSEIIDLEVDFLIMMTQLEMIRMLLYIILFNVTKSVYNIYIDYHNILW